MVDISNKIDTIVREYIWEGKYFTINRARQYGKTTMLYLLEQRLKADATVIRISFEAADEMFTSLYAIAAGLVRKIGRVLCVQCVDESLLEEWNRPVSKQFPLDDFGDRITALCSRSDKKIILMIDEVDKSSDNQIFLSFLGLLRQKYLEQLQGNDVTFQSVILAGVYDIKNLKLKLHPGQEPKYNSPWNIAADFTIVMELMLEEIAAMLREYESDYQTGMDIAKISKVIYEYTSGYPYLVSRLCQLVDERISGLMEFPTKADAWTLEGIAAAEMLLRKESNTLFDDMIKKLEDFSKLKQLLQNILFCGNSYPFERDNYLIQLGVTFGFLKGKDGMVAIGNRIFETKLYDLFLSENAMENAVYQAGFMERNRYVVNGMLQMKLVMEKFYQHFQEVYADNDQKFIEEQGRKLFLLYLKPIINGTGNYYVEAQTRDRRRADVIVDYRGNRYIIELKIWHGDEYNKRGNSSCLSIWMSTIQTEDIY